MERPANYLHDKAFCDCDLCVAEIAARDEDYAIQQYDEDRMREENQGDKE